MTSSSEEMLVGQSVLERFESGDIFVPLGHLTWIDITGNDRGKILGNLTTNHVAALEPGSGCETFITDARGKTFGHGLVFAFQDRLRLLTVPGQFERLAAQIDRYVIREDVAVEDVSPKLHAVFYPGVSGSNLTNALQPPQNPNPSLAVTNRRLGQLDVTIYQVPWTSDGDWLLVVDAAEAETLDALLVQHDVLPGHESLLHCGRIKHRYPWFGVDCDENNLPQEMDRNDKSINFRKGCYLGQETIARLDALGQVQKKLMLWQFDGQEIPVAGTELRSGEKTVATVTSATYCFGHTSPLALAVTRRSHFPAGSKAESQYGTATVVAAETPH